MKLLKSLQEKSLLLPLLVTSVILYNYLFWKESPGLNVFLFAPVFLLLLGYSGRLKQPDLRLKAAITGFIVSSVSVALYGSVLSVVAYSGAALVLTGFCFDGQLRSIWAAVVQSGLSFAISLFALFNEIGQSIPGKTSGRHLFRLLKIIVIPMLLLVLFGTIYRYANPVFNNLFESIFRRLHWDWRFIYNAENIAHLFFLAFALVLTSGLLTKSLVTLPGSIESRWTDHMIRRRKRAGFFEIHHKMIGLKTEYRMWMVLLVAINLMVAIVNITGFVQFAGNLNETSPAGMSDNVHEGTALLILSIFLTLLVLATLFRKNLNFYPENTRLKAWATAWIIQNAVLSVNVLALNVAYIMNCGITYKRIGVVYFLLLVSAGLLLTYRKIAFKKTLFYLMRTNAWVIYAATLAFALVNWDGMIARYNISHFQGKNMDTAYLLNLPDRALPILIENKTAFSADHQQWLDRKIYYFRKREQEQSWQSYNLMDRLAFKSLSTYQINPENAPEYE